MPLPEDQNKINDKRDFAIKTIEMLSPILKEKKFHVVKLKIDKKSNQINKEDFNKRLKQLNDEIIPILNKILWESKIIEGVN